MRLKKEFLTVIILVVLFSFAHWLWTLPIQNNPYPYGETDSSSHFGISNYMATTDRPLMALPYFVYMTYGVDNDFKPGTLWYPPPFQLSMALAQLFSDDLLIQVKQYYLLIASFVLLLSVSIFFLLNRLYGLPAAVLGALMMVFSSRDRMTYLFGQWPQIMGFVFMPAIVLTFYLHLKSLEKKKGSHYLYFTIALMVFASYYHPQTLFYTLTFLFFGLLFAWIKNKKLPFTLRSAGISALIFILLLAVFPYQTGNIFAKFTQNVESVSSDGSSSGIDLSQVFYWYKVPEQKPSISPGYFSFKDTYGSYLLIPFIILGILLLLMRRNTEDIVMLAWTASLYVMLHLQMVGIGRSVRFLAAEAHLFYPLIAIGLVGIPGLIRLKKSVRPKAVLFITVFALLLFIPMALPKAHSELDAAYGFPLRLTPAQFDALDWMRYNIPPKSDVLGMGLLTIAKGMWMDSVSMRHIYDPGDPLLQERLLNSSEHISHILFDYSDIVSLGLQDRASQLQQVEQDNQDNLTLIYNKANVRIYEIKG